MRNGLLIWTAVPTLLVAEPTVLTVDPAKLQQTVQGMGCGTIFYSGHVTSLGKRGNPGKQEKLYDAMFSDVRTDFLHVMIRPGHEPENDNGDPYLPEFRPEWFGETEDVIAICDAARKRLPQMEIYATLYTPPVWMKTNGDKSAGGKDRATLKPGMELELAEYCWAYLAWMQRKGHAVRYLSIANEPDWPHTQPGYCLTPDSHAALFAKVAGYFKVMAKRFPEVPAPLLVAPNVLSAVSCAEKWLPPLMKKAGDSVAVVGSHDYDRRGDRWAVLAEAAGGRPVWATEWCVNGKDTSEQLINSAGEYWLAMTEAFNGGAHAWMAYDWVYPPRQGGEALIHVDWGKGYTPTKIYHGFRQWCTGVEPGSRVVAVSLKGADASGISKPGLKASAFLSEDGKRLVIHAAAVQDKDCEVELVVGGGFSGLAVKRLRTSPTEDMAGLQDLKLGSDGRLNDVIPARGLATFSITREN